VNLLERLLGPLATEECRRSVRRNWLWWARAGAALVGTGTVVSVLWFWSTANHFQPGFLPGEVLAGALLTVEGMALTLALLLGPALVAGAIAGEKDRGTLELLLISRLSAGEIVAARFVGLFSQVGMIGAAGLPALALLAATRDANWTEPFLLAMLPAAVALGSTGLTLAASTLSRKGRDALLAVYLIEIVLIVVGALGAALAGSAVGSLFVAANPYGALPSLVQWANVGPAASATLFWSLLGVAGLGVAAWQLWPAYLRHIGGGKVAARKERYRKVPPLTTRPVLWKELHIERSAAFGWVGRWLGRLIFGLLAGSGAVVLIAMCICQLYFPTASSATQNPVHDIEEFAAEMSSITATFVVWLLQWAVALRASASVASERQHATWDALLASPLEGQEILWGKTWGSLYALRWLAAAAVFSWAAAALNGTMRPAEFCLHTGMLVAGGAFMAAAGTAVSIGTVNVTRGMATTLGIWMAAAVATSIVSNLVSLVLLLLAELARVSITLFSSGPYSDQFGGQGGGAFSMFVFFAAISGTIRFALYVLATAGIGLYLRTRFDRLAGRMPDTGHFFAAENAQDEPTAIADGSSSNEPSISL